MKLNKDRVAAQVRELCSKKYHRNPEAPAEISYSNFAQLDKNVLDMNEETVRMMVIKKLKNQIEEAEK